MPSDIMSRLREETSGLHQLAESRPLQRAMARGTLERERYAEYLGQLMLVHRALETALRQSAPLHPAFARVLRDNLWREDALARDLEFYGTDPATLEPTPATRRLIDAIDRRAEQDPVALLGMLYVLEGSTNGSKFIARALARAYQLSGPAGLHYLLPYGDEQPTWWARFREDMGGATFTALEEDALVDAAAVMFRGIAEISDELHTTVGV